jgi:hypothetical protein
VIQRGTESYRIRSVAPDDVPSTRRRKVPEGRWVLREEFSTERTRIPPTAPATQRRTCSLGNAAVCAPPSPSMKRSIAAKLIRDEATTIKRGADDIACPSVRECPLTAFANRLGNRDLVPESRDSSSSGRCFAVAPTR